MIFRKSRKRLPAKHPLVPTAASFGWTVEAAAVQRLRYADTITVKK
jgi:hypothetical protein